MTPEAQRFWAKVRKADGDACWEWTASCGTAGYGKFRRGAEVDPRHPYRGAHRVAWELTYGAVPSGLQVLHHCDNRKCVRPSHLFLGSHADNMADRNTKGRQARQRGTEHGCVKLSEEEVLDIRRRCRSGETQAAISRAIGVSNQLVSLIARGRRWGHLLEPTT